MEDIVGFFESIVEFFESIIDFIFWLIDDIVYIIELTGTLLSNVGALFVWLPGTVYATLYLIISILVIYKILGK